MASWGADKTSEQALAHYTLGIVLLQFSEDYNQSDDNYLIRLFMNFMLFFFCLFKEIDHGKVWFSALSLL